MARIASYGLAMVGGWLLRLWMVQQFFEANGDSLVYGDIAKNLVLHGKYALSVGPDVTAPTLIRLPGYPLLLAMCFRLFGMENYASVVWLQIPLELAGCVLLADFARRIAPAGLKRGAEHATLWLAALCPFTAIYAASPLAEGPTLFALALALWSAARFRERPGWGDALAFTFAVTLAALLRPDGALAAVALAPALLAVVRGGVRGGAEWRRVLRMAVVCAALAAAPFVAWTWRNWQVFHIFQPLAPQSATDPGEPVYAGWNRWVRTWCLDFVSTYNVYWNVPGDVLEVRNLPSRAFDSPEQYEETYRLADDYNRNLGRLNASLDARFARLAEERIRAHPLRYYVWLPLGRVADMWLRPRVENLPIDLDWWVYENHNSETVFSWFYAGLNALYLLLAAAGLWLRPGLWRWMLTYMVLRSVMLLTVAGPEARYTLECFPMLFALGGVAVAWGVSRVRWAGPGYKA